MTDVVCSGCLSRQAAGTQYCGVCGREFPRTGRPVVEQQPGPRSAVQRMAGGGYGASQGGQDLPYHQGGPRIDDDFHTGTFVPVRDPGPAPEPEPVYAHVGRRIVAVLVDGAVASALYAIVSLSAYAAITSLDPPGENSVDANTMQTMQLLTLVGWAGGLTLMFLWGLAMAIWEGKSGKTLGNVALGIRTLSAAGQEPVGFWRIVLRMLVVGAGSLVCGIGAWVVLLSPLWDKSGRKQGWHDKAAGAVVIDIKKKPAPVVEGFDPDSRPKAPGRGAPMPGSMAPGTSPQGGLTAAGGPANPGALRAAGQAHTAASSAGQASGFDPVHSSGQQPAAPFTPDGSAAPAQPDPWSFPKASAPATGNGLITDVPPGGSAGPFPPVRSGRQGQEPSAQQWPGVQPSTPPQQPMLPGAPPSAAPEAGPPTAASTPRPPATPNSPRPITAANTIPDHPLLETSPYPPISQPQRRDSQPTRAVSIDGPGQRHGGAAHDQASRGQHAAPAAPQAPDPDATRVEQLPDETMMQMSTGSGVALDPPPVLGAVLELESGEMVRVDGPTLVGRNPQAPGSAGVRLVQLPDPTRSVSKNHAELGVDSAGLWLTDRGSTNGTVVSVPGLPPRVAEAGARVRVPVGSTIHFGDRRVVVHPGAQG